MSIENNVCKNKEQIKSLETDLKKQENLYTSTLNQLGKKEKQIKGQLDKLEKYQQEKDDLAKELSMKTKEVVELKGINLKLVEENKKLSEECNRHVELVRNALGNNSVEGPTNETRSDVISGLKTKISQKDKEIVNLKEINATLQSLVAEGESNINILEEKVQDLDGQLRREREMNNVLNIQMNNNNMMSTPLRVDQNSHLESNQDIEENSTLLNMEEYMDVDVYRHGDTVIEEPDHGRMTEEETAVTHRHEAHSEEICVNAFLNEEARCPSSCNRNHDLNFEKIKKGVCLFEFAEKGTCRRGHECWFSHEIPEELRKDKEMIQKMKNALDKIQAYRQSKNLPRLPVKIKDAEEDTTPQEDHTSRAIDHFLEEVRKMLVRGQIPTMNLRED